MPYGFQKPCGMSFVCYKLTPILLSSRYEKEQMTFEAIQYNLERCENRRQ